MMKTTCLEAVDMDSYRVSKQQSAKVGLASETAGIYPIPVSEGNAVSGLRFAAGSDCCRL